jgi:hypothetical protein
MNTDIRTQDRFKSKLFPIKRLVTPLLVLCLLSCTSEKAADVTAKNPAGGVTAQVTEGPGAPQQSVQITPSAADHNSTLWVVPMGFNLHDAAYVWMVNDQPVADATSPSFMIRNSDAKRGDEVRVKATVKGRELLSDKVIIGNTPPEWTSIKLMPEVFKPGDTLYVDAAGKDIDDDPVTISYEWTIDGQPAGTDKSIGSPVKRGDKVSVKVMLFDGQSYSRPVVLEREIRNMPPTIEADNTFKFGGGVFTHQCRATDPDGDPLTWSLKSAPAGMTINPSTGLVSWQVPPDFAGKTSFVVTASDGHGGLATQTFNFTVSEAAK